MEFFTKRYNPPGTAPGTLTETPAVKLEPLRLRLIDYDADEIMVLDDIDASDCREYLQRDSVSWVQVRGEPTEATLRELGTTFHLHPLALEDVLNSGQRPKIDTFDDQLFIIVSLPLTEGDHCQIQQISFFLAKNFLISFCQGEYAGFEPVIKRLHDRGGRMRKRGSDYLLYSLLDMIIDQGFPVLENFGLQLEDLEMQILQAADGDTLEKIHRLKRELILLRRMLWPQREVVNQLLRDDTGLIDDSTLIYLRDCYDHTIQVMDLLETYRDMTGSMLDIYLSSISNRMNDIMRVLTIIATIFIPLTFIVGVYGMNFDRSAGPWNMPELGWPYGYLLVWLAMIVIAMVMVVFFRRRGWF